MSEGNAGTIRVLAGTGIAGDGGDGGPAVDAQLSMPVAMCIDDHGNIYIADANTFSVRRIDAVTGIITTVAGGGDDCEDEFDPDLMMEECVVCIADGCLCTEAPLDVADLDYGDGRLYMAIPDEHRIPYVDLSTGKLHTIAGTGEPGSSGDGGDARHAQLNEPSGICLNRHGELFIADTQNGLIRKVDLRSGIISTVAGGGTQSPCLATSAPTAMDARISNPRRVLALKQGDLVISSDDGVLLLKMPSGILAPLGEELSNCDDFTMGVDAMDCDLEGNLYFASSMSQSVWMLAAGESSPTRIVGSGNLGQCEDLDDLTCVDLASPRGLAVLRPGLLYFADAGVYRAFVVEMEL